MSVENDIAKLIEESEATRSEPIPEGAKGERRGRSVVQSVRLKEEDLAAIEEVAANAGVPVGALIRGWVLQGLARERQGSVQAILDSIAAEVEQLRRMSSPAA